MFVWTTSRQLYLFSLFLCWLLNIFGLDGTGLFLGPPLLLMFLLLVGFCVCSVLDNLFLLAGLYNNAVRWISLIEYLSNKLSTFSFVGFLLDNSLCCLSDSRPLLQDAYFMLFLVRLHEPGLVSCAFNPCLVSSFLAWLFHPPQNDCCLSCSCEWCSANLRQV